MPIHVRDTNFYEHLSTWQMMAYFFL